MKNIFNNLGYISKPALIGTVLGVATVAVGIGIVTNFSGGTPKAAKGFAGTALEQYASDVSSQAQQGVSKADLEAGMAAAENQRSNSSVNDLKNSASKEQFAYGDAQNGDGTKTSASALSADAAAHGAAANMGGANVAASAGQSAAQAQVAAAERAAKINAGMKAGDAVPQLVTSKMAGGSNMSAGGASSGVSYSVNKTAAENSGSVKIPQGQAVASLPKGPQVDAFKAGRSGELGGYNVKASGDKMGSNGQAYFSTTIGELSSAAKYSQAGKKTVYGDAEKGTALAQAAFDGSKPAEGVKISGTSVQAGAAQALQQSADTLGMKNKYGATGLSNVASDVSTFKDVRNQIWSHVIQAALATAAACWVIYACVKAGGFWGWLGAAASAATALLAIWGGGVIKLMNQLSKLHYSGGMNANWTITLAITALTVLTAAVALAFVSGIKAAAAAKGAGAQTTELIAGGEDSGAAGQQHGISDTIMKNDFNKYA